MDGKFVVYYRVSTDKQDTEMPAQRRAVETYLNGGRHEVLAEFVEVETGKGRDALRRRPKLAEAIRATKKAKATLLIAKLDRLARNVNFITTLQEEGVKFLACDNPHANKAMVQMMAVFAEMERDAISQRTKEALAARKAAGVRLGSPDPMKGSLAGRAVRARQAQEFALKMLPVIEGIRARGMVTLDAIAAELTRQRWLTSSGAESWAPMQIARLLKRAS